MRSRDRSLRLTSKPATAQTWAMPFPICPAPITPTDLICIYVEYLLPKGLASLSRPFALGKCISHMQHGAKTGKSAVLEAALLLFSQLPELGLELGYGLEEIGDQTVIGDLEDRRFLILVDRDDHLRVLHPGKMLNGSGDTDRDVELRRHHFSGLPHLVVIGNIAG